MAIASYPVRVEASLDPHISRWLWLVKWLLAVPHYVILSVLWVAFVAVSVIAFFAIALTGRYPPSLFEFNVGVLRWSWRVHYYTFGALATDLYPPFTLADVPDYPARLEISYPEHLSRGLVWVKWWLLAIPHYIVVGIFLGGGTWAAQRFGDSNLNWLGGGLIGVLVLIAAVVLLVTGRYPRQIFDLVLGLNRWVLRVAAYAGLMTDEYPPFRLDVGGHEPADTLTLTAPPRPIQEWSPGTPGPGPDSSRRGWTGGRIASLVAGSLLALISVGLLAAGGVATWAHNTQRDASGYLTTGTHTFATGTPALTSGQIDLGTSADVFTPSDFLGTVRFRVTPADPQSPIFVGVAPQSAASEFLSGVRHDEITNWANGTVAHRNATTGATASPPATAGIWAAQSAGTGTRTITWRPGPGNWTVVVMNTNAAPGVAVTADVGATLPDLGWIATGLLAGGGVLLLVAGALVLVPVIRASR
ncbi:MAG TPA: DUF4389 domain-containing protein [Acidimicrobiales bacterium]|nr:DUF4389 domain-containing protein [Acidimicrobiales bacterium]